MKRFRFSETTSINIDILRVYAFQTVTIMLQKIVVADEAPAMTRMAISFFAGHGVMEDFLSLPRFVRDAFIMELWEGPCVYELP